MRALRNLLLMALTGSLVLGCGKSGFFHAKGHIVKGGQPFQIADGQSLRIFFAPATAEGSRYDSYAGTLNPDDGSFEIVGKDGQGLPAGKYQVGIQLMQGKEDQLGGRLLGPQSGITLEVAPSSKDLLIDLDRTPFDKALEATARKTSKKSSSKRT
jgi:hypothetical protein